MMSSGANCCQISIETNLQLKWTMSRKVEKPKIKKAIKVAKSHPLDQTSLDMFGVTYNQLNLLQEQVVLGAAGKKE